MTAISILLIVFLVISDRTLYAQGLCPAPGLNVESNSAWEFPVFDRSRNVTFSKLYVESFGNSVERQDWMTQCKISEHLLITGKYDRALGLLRRIIVEHPDEYYPSTLLADAYQLTGHPDSALQFLHLAGKRGDVHRAFGVRFIQSKVMCATIAAGDSAGWISDHQVLGSDLTRAFPDSVAMTETMIENLVILSWSLKHQVRLTAIPNLFLARAFEEVADMTAAKLSTRRAAMLYHAGMQYDPDNTLGLATKLEQNNKRALACGEKVMESASLAASFPALHEVTQVDYQFNNDLNRVIVYQRQYHSKMSLLKYTIILVGILMIVAGIWYIRRHMNPDKLQVPES